uniref:Uncharacterized protein n=1 Tax=Schlesneria paludicola TaxID=360056 RepID=A0A7C2NTZ4_9PLAN
MILVAGFVSLWASVFAIPWGMYVATTSPRFPAYERQVEAELAAATAGRDSPSIVGPGDAWIFMPLFTLFIGGVYTAGVVTTRLLSQWRRDVALVVALVFGLGCMCGALLSLREVAHALRWGLAVQAIGALLATLGLMCGAIGAVQCCRPASQSSRDAC